MSDDYADLFCLLYDELAPSEFRAGAESWLVDPDLLATASEVEDDVLGARLTATAAHERLEQAPKGERARTRFALLLGLDGAFAQANPALAGVAPPVLSEYALRYVESGRLDSGMVPGALLPRFARPGRHGQLPDDVADAFGSVVRVPAEQWKACDHVTVPVHARLERRDRETGIRVATAPMIREPEELRWEVHERAGVRFYRIHPADLEHTRRRIEQVIDAWDEQGAAIGVAPELCLSPALLADWQAALRGRDRAATSRLRLVVAGSGNIERATPPANTAVLLDARTGELLASQRKVHPFNFSPDDLDLWGLGDRLTAPIDEDLTRGERICVVEGGGVRLAILVCEDLARLHAFAAALHAHGVSLILVPVFARPTKDRRWERARAEVYSDATGSNVVVANSLVIASILGSPTPVGAAMAVAPGHAAIGHASAPEDVVVFTLGSDEPRVAYEAASPTGQLTPVPPSPQ